MHPLSDFIVHLAMPYGKCLFQVHLACMIGTVPTAWTSGLRLLVTPGEGSDLRGQKYAALRLAAGN